MLRLEREIILKAKNHPGLLSDDDWKFVCNIQHYEEHRRLSAKQAKYLYDIGEFKLSMRFNRPEFQRPIDYKTRAYT